MDTYRAANGAYTVWILTSYVKNVWDDNLTKLRVKILSILVKPSSKPPLFYHNPVYCFANFKFNVRYCMYWYNLSNKKCLNKTLLKSKFIICLCQSNIISHFMLYNRINELPKLSIII